ncbi:MAG: hypothetical protein ACKO2V_06445 [Snowella sp.]
MKTRQEYLNALVNLDQPLSTILPILKTFPWDNNQTIITLKKEHLIQILNQYFDHSLSATDLENWANAIECREDITYETEDKDFINDIIFDLANPILNTPISPELVKQYITQLLNSRLSIAISK